MANLHETAEWAEGIYRIELDDLVEGGESGVDNRPHKELANRTAFLNEQIKGLRQTIATLNSTIDSLDERLDRVEALSGGVERLDDYVDLANRVTALELNSNNKTGVLAYIRFEVNFVHISGSNRDNEHFTCNVLKKDGEINAYVADIGHNTNVIEISLPAEFNEDTHRLTISALPKKKTIAFGILSGTQDYKIVSIENGKVRIQLEHGTFSTKRTKDHYDTHSYLSGIISVEVVAR